MVKAPFFLNISIFFPKTLHLRFSGVSVEVSCKILFLQNLREFKFPLLVVKNACYIFLFDNVEKYSASSSVQTEHAIFTCAERVALPWFVTFIKVIIEKNSFCHIVAISLYVPIRQKYYLIRASKPLSLGVSFTKI